MSDGQVPDTIGVSLESRENLRRASKSLTLVQIPGYKLTQELGRGSFGTVWQAQREQTGQSVAVKIVEQAEGLNWDYFRRELDFLREIEEHPHTLTILDAQLENNPPFIVMPLAEGGSLEQTAGQARPDLKRAEKWMWQMAEALAFIHSKGVIHCDFKPSNVLLSSGQDIRIADLGQARRTGHGLALGTIGFMAPEQCDEKSRTSPSVSWDVYGFGATMYWLLTGKIPRLGGQKDPSLSEYLEAVQSTPLEPILRLNPEVDPEMAAIVERCLALDTTRRLPSMDAVLSDMERRRHHEPLLSRRPWKVSYLLRVALKRKGVQLTLMLGLLLVLAAYAAWENGNENRFLTLSTNGIHAHESGRLEEAYLNWLEALEIRPTSSPLIQRLHFMSLDRLFPHQGRVNDLELADDGVLIAGSADGEVAFWDTSDGSRLASLKHPSHVSQLLLSPDRKTLATACWDGKARTFDVETRELLQEFSHITDESEPSSVTNLAFCDKGKLLATADVQARVKVWKVESAEERPLKDFQPDLEVRPVLATHPSRPVLAALISPNSIGLWDMATGEKMPFEWTHQAEVNDLRFTLDGRYLVSASDDQTLVVWEVDSGLRVQTMINQARVTTIALLSDTELVGGCQDGTATVWDMLAGVPLRTFYHRRPVKTLAVDEELGLLAVGTGEVDDLWSDTEPNGTVEVWSLVSGMPVAGPFPHDGPVEKVIFGEDNTVFSASGSARQTTAVFPGAVREWRYFLADSSPLQNPPTAEKSWPNGVKLNNGVVLSHGDQVAVNSYAMNKRGITATASEDRTVRLWNSKTGEEALQPILLNGPAKAVAFGPKGKLLATASQETPSSSVVRLWEVDSSYPTTPNLACPGLVRKLKFSSDGKALEAYTDNTRYTWLLGDDNDEDLPRQVKDRLRARLNARGEVVSEPILSEPVMTLTLP